MQSYESTRSAAVLAVMLVFATAAVDAGHAGAADDPLDAHISQVELASLVQGGGAPVILDVRSWRAYEKGHVPGAIHVPFWTVLARASVIPSARDEKIVVYCEHGPRAGLAKLQLRMRGFEHVVYLQGHMAAWKRAGLPLEVWGPVR